MTMRVGVWKVLLFAAGWMAAGPGVLADAGGAAPTEVRRLGDLGGLRNVFYLGGGVYSGSSPATEEDFLELKRLGVREVLSVDGARPKVELARKQGMRYTHLPHGYGGIAPELRVKLAKAAQVLEHPVYVHCHHGKHRGPAAAAVMRMSNQGWVAAQAEAFLGMAGTATNYAGLYGAVRSFRPPTERELGDTPSDFVEVAEVGGLAQAMVQVDTHWDHLRAIRAAGYQAPKDHPDLKPANEATILWELYREARRLPRGEGHGPGLVSRLEEAEAGAKEAERLLGQFATRPTPDLRVELDRVFEAMAKACSSCHVEHRDR